MGLHCYYAQPAGHSLPLRKRKAGFEVETSEETEPPEKQCSASRPLLARLWLAFMIDKLSTTPFDSFGLPDFGAGR